jgi:hypothetical protein
MTHTLLIAPPPIAARRPSFPVLPRFRPGDLVVVTAGQPLVCVVLGEQPRGLIRLSYASCPEISFVVSLPEVQPLAAWLLT